MERSEALRRFRHQYEATKDYSDPHWEGSERREHREWVEQLQCAIEELENADKYRWHDLRKNPEDVPEENDTVFAKYFGTSRWTDAMFRKSSKEVIVAIRIGDKKISSVAHTCDGKNRSDKLRFFEKAVVTHWMPMPEPPERSFS